MSVLGKHPRSGIGSGTDITLPLPPPLSSPLVASALAAIVADQLDSRFLSLDVAAGGKIDWNAVSIRMNSSNIGSRADWTPMQCQRIWRCVAYGYDIGDTAALLPDSDGEDEPHNPMTELQAAAAPHVTPSEVTTVLNKYFASVVNKASNGGKFAPFRPPQPAATQPATSLGPTPSAAPDTSSQSNVAAPMFSLTDMAWDGEFAALTAGISAAEHLVIDEAVKAVVGGLPVPTRSAKELFSEEYLEEAKRLAAGRQAELESETEVVRKQLATAATESVVLKHKLTSLVAAAVEASSPDAVNRIISHAWDALTPERRAEYALLEAQDDRRYIEALRRCQVMYKEVYRLVVLHGPSTDTSTLASMSDRELLSRAALSKPIGQLVGPAEAALSGWPNAAGRGVAPSTTVAPRGRGGKSVATRGRGRGRGHDGDTHATASAVKTAAGSVPGGQAPAAVQQPQQPSTSNNATSASSSSNTAVDKADHVTSASNVATGSTTAQPPAVPPATAAPAEAHDIVMT